MSDLHDVPSAAQLVEAVREFLEGDVMAATEGRVQFHTRVAINALNMVQRELDQGPAQEAAHRAALDRLGVADEAALAAAIRAGELDDRRAEVLDVLRQTVRAKLEVANPRYLHTTPDKPPEQ
jgi:transcriptional regulator GlxA family with amidase domain